MDEYVQVKATGQRFRRHGAPPSLFPHARGFVAILQTGWHHTPPPAPPAGLRIDRKRFRQLMEKKIALGHKPDDHEEQGYIGPAM